ncbi:MAG: glycosyltransferase family 4 protein [Kiritimatiellae bacterium]|nr:glycosyltransferase family 4 protein [Kiritimatiellia bacterium]
MAGRRKVSFLVSNLAGNSVGAVVRMARYLEPEFDAEIVGPCLWGEPNAMYRREFEFKVVETPRVYRFPEFFAGVKSIADAAEGDAVVAMKALAPALPAALRAKRTRGAKVAVYLDEWDGATSASWGRKEWWGYARRDWAHPCDDLWTPFWERRLGRADLLLGTTRFLEKKFGAVRYDLGADTAFFTPQDGGNLRRELGLEGRKVLVFGGVARVHKGLEAFAEGAAEAGWTLLVAGPENECVSELEARWGAAVRCTGALPHSEMPRHLAVGDALAVPLGTGLMAASQMPCKVYEAMAMGKPVVASAVSDVPEVLSGCGWTVAPGDAAAVASALREIAGDAAEAARRGTAARERCTEKYSAVQSGERLRGLIRDLLEGRP